MEPTIHPDHPAEQAHLTMILALIQQRLANGGQRKAAGRAGRHPPG